MTGKRRDERLEVNTLRDRIEAGERGGSDADRDLLIEFSDQMELLASQYSDARHIKLLRHCTRISEEAGGLADVLNDRDAAEAIVRWINRTYDNEETNRDYRSAIRVFARRIERADEPPESVAWIPTGTSSNYDPMPHESDMLEWEADVIDMVAACRNTRDAAAITLQFEAGLRGGELETLHVRDVVDGEFALAIEVDGKQGRRTVHQIVSVPYIQRWLVDHPAPDDGDAPLWSHLDTSEPLSYNGYRKMFDTAAKRAGITKPVTPTNFRKSNTRWLVRQGMSQTRIEDRQGRKRGSKSTGRYMARFGEESNERAYARLHGADIDEPDADEYAPIPCPRCGDPTPRHLDFCAHCKFSLDPEATELLENAKRAFDATIVNSDDPDERHDLVRARQTLEAQPNLMEPEELHELVSSLSRGASD